MENAELNSSDNLIEQARQQEAEKGGVAGPSPKINKKRGRPKGPSEKKINAESQDHKSDASGPEIKKFNIETKALTYPLLKSVSGMAVAYTKDPRAGMTADEAEGLATSLGMVLDKWMPDAMVKWGPEIVLGINVGQYGLRLYAIKRLQIEAEARKRADEVARAQPANPGPRPEPGSSLVTVLSEAVPVP